MYIYQSKNLNANILIIVYKHNIEYKLLVFQYEIYCIVKIDSDHNGQMYCC